jgi:hypothetical protein
LVVFLSQFSNFFFKGVTFAIFFLL